MKVFGFAGYSGSGKTTLMEQVVAHLAGRGFRVGVVKHSHHDCEVDVPGTDSWRHRQAGAAEVLLASPRRWVLIHETRHRPEPALGELIAHMAGCDLVLVEGFKHSVMPKLEVRRRAMPSPALWQADDDIVALVSDEAIGSSIPRFVPEDVVGIACFILRHLGLDTTRPDT